MPSRNAADWTETNTHDPGITILEALTYSLEDLLYRSRSRLLTARCGWRCTLLVAAGVATIVVLAYRREDRTPEHPRQQSRRV